MSRQFVLYLETPDENTDLLLDELHGDGKRRGSAIIHRSFIHSIVEPGGENMSRDTLLTVLDDARERVASGDSMEGTITWTIAGYPQWMAWMDSGQDGPEPKPEHPYDVEARYRIGNLMGQGGMRLIGLRLVNP